MVLNGDMMGLTESTLRNRVKGVEEGQLEKSSALATWARGGGQGDGRPKVPKDKGKGKGKPMPKWGKKGLATKGEVHQGTLPRD